MLTLTENAPRILYSNTSVIQKQLFCLDTPTFYDTLIVAHLPCVEGVLDNVSASSGSVVCSNLYSSAHTPQSTYHVYDLFQQDMQ